MTYSEHDLEFTFAKNRVASANDGPSISIPNFIQFASLNSGRGRCPQLCSLCRRKSIRNMHQFWGATFTWESPPQFSRLNERPLDRKFDSTNHYTINQSINQSTNQSIDQPVILLIIFIHPNGRTHIKRTRNSSGDEIANVNYLCNDIVHALKIQ